MADRQTRQQLSVRGEIVRGPAQRACNDQTFELPSRIYAAMTAMLGGFVMVLGLAFRGGHMPVVVGIIVAFLAAFFGVPAIFSRVGAATHQSRALRWIEFREFGIRTATGRTSAFEATILVLLLPFLILCFAVAIVSIAAVLA